MVYTTSCLQIHGEPRKKRLPLGKYDLDVPDVSGITPKHWLQLTREFLNLLLKPHNCPGNVHILPSLHNGHSGLDVLRPQEYFLHLQQLNRSQIRTLLMLAEISPEQVWQGRSDNRRHHQEPYTRARRMIRKVLNQAFAFYRNREAHERGIIWLKSKRTDQDKPPQPKGFFPYLSGEALKKIQEIPFERSRFEDQEEEDEN